jgi:hypothetical protein
MLELPLNINVSNILNEVNGYSETVNVLLLAFALVLGTLCTIKVLSALNLFQAGSGPPPVTEAVLEIIEELAVLLLVFEITNTDKSVFDEKDEYVKWSFEPSKNILGLIPSVSRVPAFTILGWLAVVDIVAFVPLPLWSYHVTTKPLFAPTKDNNAAVSKTLFKNPISCSALSFDLLTLIGLPLYAALNRRKEYAAEAFGYKSNKVLSAEISI